MLLRETVEDPGPRGRGAVVRRRHDSPVVHATTAARRARFP